MNPFLAQLQQTTRRHFFQRCGLGIGGMALSSIGGQQSYASAPAASAKSIIYLHMAGSPSQLELFDYKPELNKYHGKECPKEYLEGKRFAFIRGVPKMLGPVFKFKQHGESGMWMSELLPKMSSIADKFCMVRSMYTEAINHDPAITFFQTGSQLAGRPSIGAWAGYGLGSENKDLPAYVVLTSFGSGRPNDQPLYDRLWGAGFLPSKHQGVKFRNTGDAVLYLSNPDGIDRLTRRSTIDRISALNQQRFAHVGDPEIQARIAQYEMAFRMQESVPDLLDVSGETKETLEAYGPDISRPGSYASNCLIARRLAERDVRFIQLFHMGWDHHNSLPTKIKGQVHDTDQPTWALINDLEQRGLLKDTLIVWGGEFGRTIYSQGKLTKTSYGRDHHPRCFSLLLAGAGIKTGLTYGSTDEYCYNITENPVHVHDLNATILHLMGVDHKRLTYKYQGRDFRLTDIHGNVVKDILA